jgi:vacuolar-type H+-ATPase subunit E/Vma4
MEERLSDAQVSAEKIVAGILADAGAEALRLVEEAQAVALATKARADEQAATLRREAAAKSEAQATAILADAEAKVVMEHRKNSLALQEKLARGIVDRAMLTIARLVGEPAYPGILRAWIVEASIGLSVASAVVNASGPEMLLLDDALLASAEAEVLATTGKAVKLVKSSQEPLTGQGVYLTASDGRLAYDARVATRFERERTTIRKMIYKALFDSRSA